MGGECWGVCHGEETCITQIPALIQVVSHCALRAVKTELSRCEFSHGGDFCFSSRYDMTLSDYNPMC